MCLTTLLFAQLAYVFAIRGRDWWFRAGRNRALVWAAAGSAAIGAAVLAIPPLADRFDAVPLSGGRLAAALGLALAPFAAAEAVKALRRAHRGKAD